ncbi:MAG: hypothetical protein ACYTBJ_01825 [Planctomycetota bacterium]|jgi:hypothetical protein
MRVEVKVIVEVGQAEGVDEDIDPACYTEAGVGMVRSIMEAADANRIEVAAGWGSEEWAVDLTGVERID